VKLPLVFDHLSVGADLRSHGDSKRVTANNPTRSDDKIFATNRSALDVNRRNTNDKKSPFDLQRNCDATTIRPLEEMPLMDASRDVDNVSLRIMSFLAVCVFPHFIFFNAIMRAAQIAACFGASQAQAVAYE
jgi:hypothetical protein